ncbi:HK97 gp10 family phage protein [Paenibacillus thiaminolyticus]|uniref:HK97 gp10 family phage protein n=1 Tax=Paenibacillus thiaminolyticus TaxID=49283 RepID=UPI001161F5F3|nr:HK97 gp10 family phage protein [Paenibacillus thiaminolyticus]NGP58155.1 HK97 gp10 family phage protein [Paenibacillus thiaminolyticus]
MAKWGKFDMKQFEQFAEALEKAVDQRVIERFIRDFVMEMAYRAERKIKKRTPVNNGQLRRAWQVGKVQRRGNAFVVEIFNNTEYASFVENGFRSHWVPGYWQGKTFVYDPDSKSGMQVGEKGGWVEGRFMMAISMKEIERELPKYLQKRQAELLNDIMNGRPTRKGDADGDNG